MPAMVAVQVGSGEARRAEEASTLRGGAAGGHSSAANWNDLRHFRRERQAA